MPAYIGKKHPQNLIFNGIVFHDGANQVATPVLIHAPVTNAYFFIFGSR